MGLAGMDVSVTLDVEQTAHPVITARVAWPEDTLEIMAAVEDSTTSRHLVLYGLHMHAWSRGPNSLGWAMLRKLVAAVMEELDVDSVTISGAVRTTGAGPGRRPRKLQFKRVAAA